jgi:sulfonate transport system substrate-binding protein
LAFQLNWTTVLWVLGRHNNMRITRFRTPVVVTTAVFASVTLAACGSSGPRSTTAAHASTDPVRSVSRAPTAKVSAPASNTTGVDLVVGDQAGAGIQALLDASGYIKKLPFKVTFDDFTSGTAITQAVGSGHVDIGATGDAPVVFAAAGAAPVRIVSAYRTGYNDLSVLVRPGSGITTPAQLKGKTIAVEPGTSASYHLLRVLAKAGLTSQQVTLDNMAVPADGLAALQSGAVQAWDVWSPYAEIAEAQGDKVLVNGSHYGAIYSYQVASSMALKNPKLVAAIGQYLYAVNRASRWAVSHRRRWTALWAAATGLPLTVATRAIRDNTEIPIPVNSTIVASEQSLVDTFSEAGLIPRDYNFAPYVTAAFNNSV